METKTNNFLCGSCRVSFSRELEYGVKVEKNEVSGKSHCTADPREKEAGAVGDEHKIACACGNVDSISLIVGSTKT